jgi:hypothetical protein
MSTQTITIKGRCFDAVTGAVVPRPAKPVAVKPETPKHTLKPSSTLMRAAVKKPSHQTIRVQPVIEDKAPEPRHVIATKVAISTVSQSRSERAEQTRRSEKVSRFGGEGNIAPVSKHVEHVPVQLAPENPEETEPAAPEPKRTNTPDMFVRAITNASHFVDLKEHHAKQRRAAKRHAMSMATGFAALLVIAGFAAYINMPGLQIRIAGIQAGVSAIQPNFEKAGFAYSGVEATDGKRIIGLQANGNKYQLLERSTNWDGKTMINTVSSVSANGTPNYKEVSVGAHTVYRFNEKQATWVKDGTWYHLSGDAAISDSQLASLVQNT